MIQTQTPIILPLKTRNYYWHWSCWHDVNFNIRHACARGAHSCVQEGFFHFSLVFSSRRPICTRSMASRLAHWRPCTVYVNGLSMCSVLGVVYCTVQWLKFSVMVVRSMSYLLSDLVSDPLNHCTVMVFSGVGRETLCNPRCPAYCSSSGITATTSPSLISSCTCTCRWQVIY